MTTAHPPLSTPMSDSLLQVDGVTRRFGGVTAAADITLDVPRGQIAGLIGPNGSGKTTLFGIVSGHLRLDGGRVLFDGADVTGLDEPATSRRGLLRTFQQPQVYGSLTCLENLQISNSEPSGLFRAAPATRKGADDWLGFVGLSQQRALAAGALSFGQRKLLEFAMALMRDPRMILLDEPTAGVSPVLAERMGELLRHVNGSLGVTLLIVEHNMPFLMGLADRVHCLAQGRLIASGTPEAIREDPRVRAAYLGSLI
jgi:ABC-type branched-subunit amino acid transport system ATPase component